MNRNEAIKHLRDRKNLQMFDKKDKIIVQFQLNKKETKFICWERWHKSPGATHANRWVNQNRYLSLKDVMRLREQIINNNTTRHENAVLRHKAQG